MVSAWKLYTIRYNRPVDVKKGWSPERLGQEAKVPQSHIARIEGGADVRISTVRRVLVALGYEIQFHPSLSDRFTHPVPGGRIAAARDFAVQNANGLAELFTCT